MNPLRNISAQTAPIPGDTNGSIGVNNYFAPGTIIGRGVTIGDGNTFGPNTIVMNDVRIGNGNTFGISVAIGTPSRERVQEKYSSQEEGRGFGMVTIGDRNYIGNNVTIEAPLQAATGIHNDVAIGPNCFVGHDTEIRDGTIIAANASFGGYVIVGANANIGMAAAVHPRSVIGAFAMCGMNAAITRHVFPAALIMGVPARVARVNRVGLERFGVGSADIDAIEVFFEEDASIINCSTWFQTLVQEFQNDCIKWKRLRDPLPLNER